MQEASQHKRFQKTMQNVERVAHRQDLITSYVSKAFVKHPSRQETQAEHTYELPSLKLTWPLKIGLPNKKVVFHSIPNIHF